LIEAVPCPANRGSVDLRDSRYPDDVLHASAAEWAEFLDRAKSGTYDQPGRADGNARPPGWLTDRRHF
jgi:hypothetical protein